MPDFPFQLDPFQVDAMRHLDLGRSLLVCAPTGTGKTVIADHMVQKALEGGREIIYTAPIKALSNQKFRDWCRLWGPERIGLVTGDLVIRREAPCRVMTTEILRNMLLAGDPLDKLRHVILDEIHFLDDRERGTTWEELLIYLPHDVQILGLSATLSNLEDFAGWLSSVRGRKVEVIRENHRAVPLELMIFSREHGLVAPQDFERFHKAWLKKQPATPLMQAGRSSGRPHSRQRPLPRAPRIRPTSHLEVFERLRKGFLPYLYFVFSRANTERFAAQLVEDRPLLLDDREQRALKERLAGFESESPGVLDRRLREMLSRGIAFHHAGAHVLLKALVEELYEKKLIKVLYCTSTFALGINMPARAVVLDGLRKYDGSEVVPLTVRQFMQKAGRAGRRGMDDVGYAVIRMDHESWAADAGLITRYRSAVPERVHSAFNLSFNSVVNLLARHPAERIRGLISNSFLAWRLSLESRAERALMQRLEGEIRRELRLLDAELLPPQSALPPPLRRKAREIERLDGRVRDRNERCWLDFELRTSFLQSIGYLGPDLSFQAGARVIQHVQIAEIFITELFLEGILEEIEPPMLFGLMCGVVQDLPRGTTIRYHPDERTRRIVKEIQRVLHGRAVREADRILNQMTNFSPDLIIFGRGWAEGRSLKELLDLVESPTDVAGDLVGAFRRARDLVGQLKPLWAEDPLRTSAIRALLDSTARDEVEVVD